MRYVPANELERVVLERLKALSMDENVIQQIVEKANGSSAEEIQAQESHIQTLRNQLLPVEAQIKGYVDSIGQGFDRSESVLGKLLELEAQKKQLDDQIQKLSFHLKDMKQKRLDAQTMKDSLIRFSQILDIATPEEKKSLIPRIVESVTFTPTQIEIALFDHLIERGLLRTPVNHSDDDALELSRWLPRLDSNQRQGG